MGALARVMVASAVPLALTGLMLVWAIPVENALQSGGRAHSRSPGPVAAATRRSRVVRSSGGGTVPRPVPAQVYTPPATRVVALPNLRGVYLTARAFADPTVRQQLWPLAQAGDINAVVINVKSDNGHLLWPMNSGPASQGTPFPSESAFAQAMAQLRAHGITPVARIVCFKDPVMAAANPGWAIYTRGGALYRDPTGAAWLDPTQHAVRAYVRGIAVAAARAGFPIVQLDYVRFPSDGISSPLAYAQPAAAVPATISAFAGSVRQALPPGTSLDLDVFGLVTVAHNDMGIGQLLHPLDQASTYLSPMTYPALYAPYSFGYPDPAAHPFGTVYYSLSTAAQRLGSPNTLIPWIEDFSLQDPYGPAQLARQVEAVRAAGIHSYWIWNPACYYPPSLFALVPKQP